MDLNDALSRFERFPLLDGPTPIQRLSRLESRLGSPIRIHVKRDDLMGVGLGGNKLRKLEFLVGQALAQGCDTFITTGGLQSNHARLTAAASARAGLACELVLADMVAYEDEAYAHNGNVLLDQLFGAAVHRVARDADPLLAARQRAGELQRQGRKAYVVGLGGSSPLGALGYVACAAELLQQERAMETRFSRIVIPTGSFGTHAGLLAGLQWLGGDARRVRGYTILARQDVARQRTASLVEAIFSQLRRPGALDADAIDVTDSQLGPGYGLPTPAMIDAVRLLARTEGLVLDPVYSGKAFAGLLASIRAGEFAAGGSVLFIMTGGSPGVYAYRSTLENQG
ncbi:1-aminocyclopropane-1-carboxylate deaminase [Bordetella ansorpii]|uniref:1-aminocyclopropane-1-carboxylate deaminase n=1 Tax=Bordetella ansorpii TaxID=288768 RepID=A0A157SVQ3_9BORD|nr:D-cysteine desulfhydrase family protein [Bordetella ansorpii]SAI74527.1 1-aminocyclopropane-1-carboxylate deaminase [Bordetella ansorpii]